MLCALLVFRPRTVRSNLEAAPSGTTDTVGLDSSSSEFSGASVVLARQLFWNPTTQEDINPGGIVQPLAWVDPRTLWQGKRIGCGSGL